MVIKTTLKGNKEAGKDYLDIALYVDECFVQVADLFENSKKYYWEGSEDSTDLDILCQDYTDRQIASACLKYMKTLTKGKEPMLMIWNKNFIELDCDGEIAFDQVKELIEDGTITGSNQLREINLQARKKGTTIKKGYRYGENDIYFGYHYIQDLIDEHFPCYADMNDSYCNNCGNCH